MTESIKFKTLRRFNDSGHAHELTFSCFRRIPLLSKDRSRRWFIDMLDRARHKHEFAVLAYVIMPEHVHVLVWPRRQVYDISRFLSAVKWPVAMLARSYLQEHSPRFLERLTDRRPDGAVTYRFWQRGGGYDRNMFSRDAVPRAIQYIHNNPVRRGLSATAEDWPWSSAAWYAGRRAGAPMTIDGDVL